MRNLIAAVAALCVVACVKETAPKPRFELDTIELAETYGESRPAEGNVFAIARVTEDPAPPFRRHLFGAVLEDWDGNTYEMKWSGGSHSRSGDKIHPDKLYAVFEIPRTATPRSVTIPVKFETAAFHPTKPEERPKLVHGLDPHYPPAWKPDFYRDWLRLEVFVDAEGRVGGAKAIDYGGPAAAWASEAVRHWRYEPAHRDGGAVASIVEETVRFHPAPALGQYDVEPKAVHRVEPRILESTLRRRPSDTTVQFEIVVDADGRVETGRTLNGDDDLADAAMEAVRQWRYEPALLNGKPVAATIPVVVRFQLDGSP